MESITHFFANWSPQQLGFSVSALIFLITTFLVARRLIGFSVTFLFLVFALLAGFIVSDQEEMKHSFRCALSSSSEKKAQDKKQEELQKAYDALKKEFEEKISHLNSSIEKTEETGHQEKEAPSEEAPEQF